MSIVFRRDCRSFDRFLFLAISFFLSVTLCLLKNTNMPPFCEIQNTLLRFVKPFFCFLLVKAGRGRLESKALTAPTAGGDQGG